MLSYIKRKFDIFHILSILIGCLIIIPILNILFQITGPTSETWLHIRNVMLIEFISNTIILVIGVAAISSILGLFLAYVVVRFDFRTQKLLKWMLILPLAIPSYIAAYLYADMFSYTGTIARALRSIGIMQQLNMMNMGGAIVIFSLTLFPYVYILSLSALTHQSASYEESAKLLGASKIRAFFTVTLPLVRPALVAGVLLTILETLNDYGLVSYFNVRVFSFAIFNAWFSLGDLTSAIRLSAYLMLFVLVIILIERFIRGKRRYQMHIKSRPIKQVQLKGFKAFLIPFIAWTIMAFGFVIPVVQLIWYLSLTFSKTISIRVLYVTLNSLSIALAAAFIVVIFAIVLSNFNRMKPNNIKKSWLKITNLGYAIPGAVIAIAVNIFFIDIDKALYPMYRFFNPDSPKLLLTLSLVMLLFAYVLRFMAIGFNAVESSYEKIGKQFTEASYVLGSNRISTLVKIDVPLLKPGLISALILVFIDVIKELPLTLILRPANYDTLASMVYVYASDEMIQESSLASLVLIFVSAVLIYTFTHFNKKETSHVR